MVFTNALKINIVPATIRKIDRTFTVKKLMLYRMRLILFWNKDTFLTRPIIIQARSS